MEAADNYVVIHTTAGERLMPRDTLLSIEGRLGTQHFARAQPLGPRADRPGEELQPNSQGDYSILLRNGIPGYRSAGACAGGLRNSSWKARQAGTPRYRRVPLPHRSRPQEPAARARDPGA